MRLRIASVQIRRWSGALLAAVLTSASAAPASADVAVDPDQTVVSEVGGNGTGALDPGERFSLTQSVQSLEFDPLTSVTGVLRGDPAVTVETAGAGWPDLQFGQPAANLTPFTGTISAAAECGVPLPMEVALSTSRGPASVPLTLGTGVAGPATVADATDVPMAIPDPGTVSSTISVPTAGRVKTVRVRVTRLDHTYDGDLQLRLIAPDGTSVMLANGIGDDGQGFSDTVFDGGAAQGITAGTAPYTGTFRPQGDLGRLVGTPAQGDWRLQVTDGMPGDRGALVAWGLDVSPAVCTPVTDDSPPGFARRSDKAKGQWPDPPGWQRNGLDRHAKAGGR